MTDDASTTPVTPLRDMRITFGVETLNALWNVSARVPQRCSDAFRERALRARRLENLLASVDPALADFVREIEARAPGAVEKAIEGSAGLALIRARALDTHQTPGRTRAPRRYRDEFVQLLIKSVDPRLDLIRVSATAPRGRDKCIRPLLQEYAARVSAFGTNAGAFLVKDVRKDGGEHLYGIIEIELDEAAVGADLRARLAMMAPRAGQPGHRGLRDQALSASTRGGRASDHRYGPS